MKKIFEILLVSMSMTAMVAVFVHANNIQLPDGTAFDFVYYEQQNPDVVQAIGNKPEDLANHYWLNGIQEGRLPFAGAKDVSASSVIALANDYRSKNGLEALAQDSFLMAAAQQRARELADSRSFAHTRPNGEMWTTVLKGHSLAHVAENLGRGQTSASSVIYAWQKSSSHNATLLDAKATKVGVGVAKGNDGQFYFWLIVSK